MVINRKKFIHRRGKLNMIVIRVEQGIDKLDFIDFIDDEEGIMYLDSSGYLLPLDRIIIEDSDGVYQLDSILKNKLSKKMCKILGETDKYYIIKADK